MSTQPQVIEFRGGREVLPDGDASVADAGRILSEAEAFIARYVILPEAARLPVALWAVATHAFNHFDCFPYLSLSSPTPRCGKTRLLEVLELLVSRPWRGTAPTEAAHFRFIETKQPTLLLDEVEGLAKRHASDRDSAVLAILNAGYKSGQSVPRCVGNAHELQDFRVYCPKAFASIGNLPPTLADRSIVVPMQRRSAGESVARFRSGQAKREAEPIRIAVERTIEALTGEIKKTYSELPDLSFLTDRDAEIFSPLFAVCAVFAPERISELEKAAKMLSDDKAGNAVDDSLALRLLQDMRLLWPDRQENWLTREILVALKSLEESPWQSEVELSPHKLGRMLKPFEVLRRQVRTPSGVGKGYVFAEIDRTVRRYMAQGDEKSETRETTRMNTG